MSKVPGMCFFYDWREAFELMSPADCKKMLLAMLDFSRNGTEPPEFEDPKAKMAAMFIFSQMRRSQMKAEIGKIGGKKSIQNRLEPVVEPMVEPMVEPEIEPVVEGCLNPKLNINKTKQNIYETRQDDITAADAAAPSPSGKEENEAARRIIGYLNEKTGKHFRDGDRTIKLIRARMKEGFDEDDFRTVIDNKTAEWSHDARMAEYLRPETLFGTKFESYLNAAPVGQAASYGAGRESDGESSFDTDSMFEAALRRSYGDMGINVKTN